MRFRLNLTKKSLQNKNRVNTISIVQTYEFYSCFYVMESQKIRFNRTEMIMYTSYVYAVNIVMYRVEIVKNVMENNSNISKDSVLNQTMAGANGLSRGLESGTTGIRQVLNKQYGCDRVLFCRFKYTI